MPLSDENRAVVDEVAARLRQCRSLLFITGAGISADSGLPTYRGIGGLYNTQDTDDDLPIELVLSGQMMAADPALCWKYIYQIERACRGARHNRAHTVIAEMGHHFERVVTLTQNVDGFHRTANTDRVIDIHGDIHHLRCTRCSYRCNVEDYSDLDIPPACPECGGVVRPDVVLFGEMLPHAKIAALSAELSRGFDIVFSVGTTSVFPYIAGPVFEAVRWGVPTVEINPGITEVTHVVEYRIPAGAAESLDGIWASYRKREGSGHA